MYDLVIQNGTIITPTSTFQADIAVKDGKICTIATSIPADGTKTVDAAGKLVLPGAIDPTPIWPCPSAEPSPLTTTMPAPGLRSAAVPPRCSISPYRILGNPW